MTGAGGAFEQGAKRYIRLSIKADTIDETHSEGELSFETTNYSALGKTKEFTNTLGFIPCVEIINNAQGFSNEGVGEFDQMANHICTHDDLMRTMRKNITFFGNIQFVHSKASNGK